MTIVEPRFDPETRDLVIPRPMLLALGRVGAGLPLDRHDVEPLERLGLLRGDGTLVEEVADLAIAVARPELRATISLLDHRSDRAADLWIGADWVVVHPVGDPRHAQPVVVVGVAVLPSLVARSIDIGPRPHRSGPPFWATADEVAEGCRHNEMMPWADRAGASSPQLWQVTWQATHGKELAIAVLDLGFGGLWKPNAAKDGALEWVPTAPPEVWRALARLFQAARTTSGA